ncbi:MAG: ABC transporter permease [Chloroflexi bacterium]|nr:ABC transporter permease [Chloroflexota bacterium]
MDFLADVAAWFADPANWSGAEGVSTRLLEHIALSAIPLAIAILVALPLGAWIGHTGRAAGLVINLANVGRAIPSLAILGVAAMVLNVPLVELGLRSVSAEVATIIAMTALAIPPILTNAYAGISEVDRDLVDAGRGMGMHPIQVLRRVEVPVGLPIILGGIRTAAVQVVATATLGAVFATGGFGRYIIDGIAQRRNDEVFAGALMVALLSIATELSFAAIQRRAISPGLGEREAAGRTALATERPAGA